MRSKIIWFAASHHCSHSTLAALHMIIELTRKAFGLQGWKVSVPTSDTSLYYPCWTLHLSVIINVCFQSLQRFPSTGSPPSKPPHCRGESVIDRRSCFEVFHAIYWFPPFKDVQIRKCFPPAPWKCAYFRDVEGLILWRYLHFVEMSLYEAIWHQICHML